MGHYLAGCPYPYDQCKCERVPALGWHLQMYQDALQDRDAVIARLLDGYEPHPDRNKQGWWRPGSPERPEMSDGEAAIIRNHQERTP